MSKRAVDLSLLLACYNEQSLFTSSLLSILKALKRSRFVFEIIFVDDGSVDRTPQMIKKFCQKNSFSRALYHESNKGRGISIADGMKVARGKVVGYIDIDCEVSPVYISEMVELIQSRKADVVLGKRVYRTSLHSIIREMLSIGYKKLADRMLGTHQLDTESGYKFFNRKKILPVLSRTRHPHWFWDTEIIVYAQRAGLHVVELPVLFLRRTDKESSVRIVRDTMDYLVHVWKLRQNLAKT